MHKTFNNDDMQFVCGSPQTLNNMPHTPALQPFCDAILDFFNDLSKLLIFNKQKHSDVATFGFWCRKASLLSEKAQYTDLYCRLGRGVVFHIAPSNVPVNFAFTLAAGLLAGNANVVRLPSKNFEQIDIICSAINQLLATTHQNLAPYICLVKYPTTSQTTDSLSLLCDCRVIWGGDNTINQIRKSPLSPRANDLTFADRFSIAIINAKEYLEAENKPALAQAFYNDTYFSDQNACTSPRIVVWLGANTKPAQELFWQNLYALVIQRYTLTPAQAVAKLQASYKLAQAKDCTITTHGNLITRVAVTALTPDLPSFKHSSGFFIEYATPTLTDILPICTHRCQTLTHYKLPQAALQSLLQTHAPRGIDRIVPLGSSTNFSLTWDGHNTITTLSRTYQTTY